MKVEGGDGTVVALEELLGLAGLRGGENGSISSARVGRENRRRTSSPTRRTTNPLSATHASASLPPSCSLTTTLNGLLDSLIGAPRSASASDLAARIASLRTENRER